MLSFVHSTASFVVLFGHSVLDPGLENQDLVGGHGIFSIGHKIDDAIQSALANGHGHGQVGAILGRLVVERKGRRTTGVLAGE